MQGKKTKKNLAMTMEWIRPVGVGLAVFFANYFGIDAISQFHIMGPFIVILMSGSVAFESLLLGEVASEKIGYAPNRAYQIQSGMANVRVATIDDGRSATKSDGGLRVMAGTSVGQATAVQDSSDG